MDAFGNAFVSETDVGTVEIPKYQCQAGRQIFLCGLLPKTTEGNHMNSNHPTQTISDQSGLDPMSSAGYLDRYLAYLASPPVLSTEPNEHYRMLRRELFNELKPESVLEAQFIEDVVYNTWQIRRLRQAQVELVQRALIEVGSEELSAILFANKRFDDLKIETLGDAKAMAIVMILNALAGDQAAAEVIENVLMDMKQLSWAGLHALAIDTVMASYSRLEQMTHLCERQRQALFKDYVFIGQAKAMLLQQRSNEAIAQIPCPKAAESLTGRPDANTSMTSNLVASSSSAGGSAVAADRPGPVLAEVGMARANSSGVDTVSVSSASTNTARSNASSACQPAANTMASGLL